ncbi:hypothetical protein F7731_07450 [Cytobacillus depressus]|uniref:Uncharacterized protein n=1 Tax=Cytobacillus depressus TaxID=1602942 RepID=A0A6L3V7M4_9BACI|nr:hypothetical protein F7731_07450 [Cytobacillus depressus]
MTPPKCIRILSCDVHSRMLIQCPAGNRGKRETPQAVTPRRLSSLPAESKCPQRKSTGRLRRLKITIYAKRTLF